ncbi:MAG TPA: hypothetical protein PLO37_01400 [Candidatus Hydrogenedentes bacterium]|nr:hypothetical protein [Candidatus Hydrogenedentota bacterium]HPG65472.1 hypothetical protein [Candidatus Hydrogenedentota bacterium]
MAVFLCLTTTLSAVSEEEAPSYFARVEEALRLCGGDWESMVPVAEEAATRLAGGGAFWCGGQPSLVSELCGRAGGFMMLKGLGDKAPAAEDVVLYIPQDGVATPDSLSNSSAYVIVFGRPCEGTNWPCFSNHADEAGISPTLANAIPGWIFTGELVAALTRLGKMPVMYESIGAYDGAARIREFENGAIAWHDEHHVSPIDAGVLGGRYVEIMIARSRRLDADQRDRVETAARWAAEAHAGGKATVMYSMGHLFPDEIGETAIGSLFRSGVWNAGFRRHAVPDDTYAEGDLIVHIGYQHPPSRLLERARSAGARVAYLSVYADREFAKDPGVIWIDCMWPWPDAVVDVKGYDIPILASSGILNGAVAWEIYRLMKLGLGQ